MYLSSCSKPSHLHSKYKRVNFPASVKADHPTEHPKDNMESLNILHAGSTSTSFGEHKQSKKCVCKMPAAEGQALFRLRSTASKRSNTLLAQLCSSALSGSLCLPSHSQREARTGKRRRPLISSYSRIREKGSKS